MSDLFLLGHRFSRQRLPLSSTAGPEGTSGDTGSGRLAPLPAPEEEGQRAGQGPEGGHAGDDPEEDVTPWRRGPLARLPRRGSSGTMYWMPSGAFSAPGAPKSLMCVPGLL